MKRPREQPLEEERARKRVKPDEGEMVLRFQNEEEESEEYVDEKMITPWYKEATRSIQDPMLRFHNEVIDFVRYLQPTEEEHRIREEALEFVRTFIKKGLGQEVQVESFGSFRTRTYLPNADIDIVVIGDQLNDRKAYDKLYSLLEEEDSFSQVTYIRSAKVPLIKFVYTKYKLHFDVTVNKFDGVTQLKQVEKAIQAYPELKYLIFLNKCMLKQRELSQTYTGGVGSFLLFCMVLCFLRQCRRHRHNYTLGEYVLRYLEFYGIDSWTERRILMKRNQIVHRPADNVHFSLLSPQDETHDIGSSAFKIKDVFAVYRNRYRLLTNYNFKNGESIVKYLVNPSGTVFAFLKEEI